MNPRVLIFGAGGIGAGYAYALLRKLPPKNVVAVCRSNYEAASRHGFKMNSTIWGSNLTYKPTVVRSVEEAVALDDSSPFDYVLVTSKATQSVPATSIVLKPAISEKTAIVLIQNGIAIEEEYAKQYPNNALLSVVVYFAVTQIAPAVLDHSEIEMLRVGTYPANAKSDHKEVAKSFVQLATDCGATAKLHDDIQRERWAKLLLNTSLNPICALSRLRDTQFIHSGEGALDLMKETMAEIASVAHAYGYADVNEDLINVNIGRVQTRRPPGVEPSMMADALAGKSMEVEAIIGNVYRLAKEKGVETPLIRTLYILTRALNNSFN